MGTDPYANKGLNIDTQASVGIVKQVIQAVGGLVGVIAMVVGVAYAARLLKLVFELLSNPDGFTLAAQLAEILGGEQLAMPSANGAIPLAMPLAIGLLILALLVIGWLSLGLILTGAKVLAFCLADRESMKELLAYALGQRKTQGEGQAGKP
jgi:hypothetical protein